MGEKIQVDFRHFVKLSKSNVISWDSLSTLLHEMASNFALSKELNKVLLEELKASETKIREILANEKDRSIEGNWRNQPAEVLEESDQNITLNLENETSEIEDTGNNPNKGTGYKMSIGSQQAGTENGQNQNDTEELEVEIVKEDSLSPKKYACKICWKRFSSKPQFESHQKIHENEKPQECKTCGQRLSLSCIMNEHKKVKTTEVSYNSESNADLNPEKLKSDGLTNNELDVLKAEEFDEESNVIKSEEKSNKAEHPYKCKACGKLFTLGYNLKRHEKIHRNERPYQCTTCLKYFRRKCHLIKHNKKIHQIYENFMVANEMKSAIANKQIIKKSFDCQTCNKRFDKSSKLKVHETIHTGEKPHKCKVCERCFRLPYDLQKHLRRHAGERPYRCNTCLKVFIEAYELKDHLRTHEKPFDCESCGKKFSRPKSLRVHMKIHNQKTDTA